MFMLFDVQGVDVKKNIIITISSDKGLCGGINSTAVKISRGIHKLTSGTLQVSLCLELCVHSFHLFSSFLLRT